RAISQPWQGVSNVLAVSPDGAVLAVSKVTNNACAVELLDTRSGQPLSRADDPVIPLGASGWGLSARDAAAALSADGRRLAVAGDHVTVGQVTPRRKLAEVAEQASRPVFSPDGTRVAYVSGADAKIADAAGGQVRRTIKGHDGGIDSLAFSRD